MKTIYLKSKDGTDVQSYTGAVKKVHGMTEIGKDEFDALISERQSDAVDIRVDLAERIDACSTLAQLKTLLKEVLVH